MMPGVSKPTHRWTRIASAKWEDAWEERLRFLGPSRLAMITWPDSRALKIEAYCDARTAQKLVRQFGGRATRLAPHVWSGAADAPRAPISIRGKLKVFSSEPDWRKWEASSRKPPGILIPAGMAFGTGEHATTATCLRMLSDLVPELGGGFRAADLGCGSGILAIAAEKLGASSVEAVDNDPDAVRTAKANARANGCKAVKVARGSAVDYKTAAPLDLVLANLFSELLIQTAPAIVRALRPGGAFVFSGVLVRQFDEVAAALTKLGLVVGKPVARGKWCAATAKKSVGRKGRN